MHLLAAIRRGTTHSAKAALYILLLAFYVAGTSQVEVLHELIHSHNNLISHSQQEEKDPCHRAVYHHETEKGCGHSHIVVTDKCELCDLISHTDQVLLSRFDSPSIEFVTVDFVCSSSDIAGAGQSNNSSRAPPASLNL
jgi:hypothetical protein